MPDKQLEIVDNMVGWYSTFLYFSVHVRRVYTDEAWADQLRMGVEWSRDPCECPSFPSCRMFAGPPQGGSCGICGHSVNVDM